MHSAFEHNPRPLTWDQRIVSRLIVLCNDGTTPEQAQERAALNVQVGHIMYGWPVARALPRDAFLGYVDGRKRSET